MNTDLSFITNQENISLKKRFRVLIKDSLFFDSLSAYFYSSGFYAVYPALKNTKKIRILIGIGSDKKTFDIIEKGNIDKRPLLDFSFAETKTKFENQVKTEMANSADNKKVEEGVYKFIEWIKSGKLQIKAYPSRKLHAKLYIMTFKEGDRDAGRIITGSSNFTKSGLSDNLEFNVELKNRSDYEFAKKKFEELWQDAVDVSQKYIDTINGKTWLAKNITPYTLYLKFLYEYFKEDLNLSDQTYIQYMPFGFKKFEYQRQAILNAKKIVSEYGGVFIADVVGLGKTYIATMLSSQLAGRTLVIAPPALLKKSNPGSWSNLFSDFNVPADFESAGKLDHILKRGTGKYSNIIIDEAHRFRNESTATYGKLAEICRGKKVILVTATPLNNTPKDILSLIKLFQDSKKSGIMEAPDLELFFGRLEKKLKNLDRKKDYDKYIDIVKQNAKQIRNKVLKHLMVRRTRNEIKKYFAEDIKKQGLKFPKVERPTPLFYQLNKKEDEIFNKTIKLITDDFKYARYMPMLYYQGKINQFEAQSQKNLGRFMKVLLVKRLESSFFAFRNSIERFINSYEIFLKEFKNGYIYISKKDTAKIFEALQQDNDEVIQKLIDKGRAEKYEAKDFNKKLKTDLEYDLAILKNIEDLWRQVKRDPKLLKFKDELLQNKILKKNHIIIFTESKETADYLYKNINSADIGKPLKFTGESGESIREKVLENFDANVREQKNDYRILISTEVLSEGVNLHRANTVINYDIPWNPTRMMQRAGRINRVAAPFSKIYTFNFFPTAQANSQIGLKEAAKVKINAFLTLLGGDAELLTEGEPIASHQLFDKLISKTAVESENDEESELKYLHTIKEIRENQPEFFEKIKKLPPKARSAKKNKEIKDELITYFRSGKLQKFFIANPKTKAKELDFITAAGVIKSRADAKTEKLPKRIYGLLKKNKNAFKESTTQETDAPFVKKGAGSAVRIIKILKATLKIGKQLTDEQTDYLKKLITRLNEGGIPKQTCKNCLQELNKLNKNILNPLKTLEVLQTTIPDKFLEKHYTDRENETSEKREIILSLYLRGE